jgi:hypothetical protein
MKDFKSYPLKEICILDSDTIVLRFYLTRADWDISNDIFEVEIISKGVDRYVAQLNSMIGIQIFLNEENGELAVWEGENEYECSTGTSIPFESYNKRFVPKSSNDWKQQYLSLFEFYYNFRRQAGI